MHTQQPKMEREGYRQAPISPPKPATLPFHLLFPLTTSLSSAVAARPRGELSRRDSRPHNRASCTSWQSVSQPKATFASSQHGRKGEILSAGPRNPMTRNASLLSKLCFKPGHQGFNASAVSVSLAFQIVSDVSRRGQQLLVGHRQTNSSCCSSESSNQTRLQLTS